MDFYGWTGRLETAVIFGLLRDFIEGVVGVFVPDWELGVEVVDVA